MTVSVLGRDEGCTVKYSPSPEGVPEGKARGNSRLIIIRLIITFFVSEEIYQTRPDKITNTVIGDLEDWQHGFNIRETFQLLCVDSTVYTCQVSRYPALHRILLYNTSLN